MTSSISKQLKEKRKLSGLSVKEVVSRLSNYGVNISDKTYYGWEMELEHLMLMSLLLCAEF